MSDPPPTLPPSGALPHVTAFPGALGTGIIINTSQPIPSALQRRMREQLDAYEHVLSRFREDSLVTEMAQTPRGGSFDFPDDTRGLFELYDRLYAITNGAIDPTVGADLVRLGYRRGISFDADPDAATPPPPPDRSPRADSRRTAPRRPDQVSRMWGLGRIHGRATWEDVDRHGTTLTTRRAVRLDFGAAGKGYLVDLLARSLAGARGGSSTGAMNSFIIDAGGDLWVDAAQPISIGLEDPQDLDEAVGVARIRRGAFCASAPSRRHWRIGDLPLHHLLNAIDGLPVTEVSATWVSIAEGDRAASDRLRTGLRRESPLSSSSDLEPDRGEPHRPEGLPGQALQHTYPTAVADGIATALFVSDPETLRTEFAFECALMLPDRHALVSRAFPGAIFTA